MSKLADNFRDSEEDISLNKAIKDFEETRQNLVDGWLRLQRIEADKVDLAIDDLRLEKPSWKLI